MSKINQQLAKSIPVSMQSKEFELKTRKPNYYGLTIRPPHQRKKKLYILEPPRPPKYVSIENRGVCWTTPFWNFTAYPLRRGRKQEIDGLGGIRFHVPNVGNPKPSTLNPKPLGFGTFKGLAIKQMAFWPLKKPPPEFLCHKKLYPTSNPNPRGSKYPIIRYLGVG